VSLRCWVLDAKSGNTVGEVIATGGQLRSALGGGDCSLTVSLSHLTREDGTGMDVAAVKRTLALLDGGRRSIVVTDEQKRIVGGTEWLLMGRGRSTVSGSVSVSGIEWAGYPALRSLNNDFVYTSSDQLTIARVLLTAAFLSFNTGMQITIPAVTSGVARSLERRAQTAYFSDALDEISSPGDGFDWRVDVTPTWDGDELVSVSRAVAFGYPVLSRPSSIVFSQGSPGSVEGNAFGITGGDDFSRYAQSVYGIGAGQGAKQLKVGLSDPTLTNAGYLNSTKNVSFPDVTNVGVLTALTRGELVRAQDLRDPFSAKALLAQLAAPPAVGDRIRLESAPTWNYPDGLDELVRVGEVSFELGQNPTASVAAI
jgi:hypothetical protein